MGISAGSRIGPYEVTGQLGAGGMGEVFKARDTKLNRTVAIKALQSTVVADPDRIARFEREAQLLASLHHPAIAGIYGLEHNQGATYLVLEFVDGQPLDAIIAGRRRGAQAVDIPEAIKIARQIADAIAAAHEKGIIHRDLKPGNVMVTADGQVKVLDFGLGKSLDDGKSASGETVSANSPTITLGATQAGLILGTAGYMSPEQAKGRAADRRSDVWSFGCILFELLAGSRAFEGEDVTDTIAAIVRGEPNWKALPPTTPAPVRTLIERCLTKDRNERLADMSVVRYILNEPNLLSGSSPSATASTTPAPARVPAVWMIATAALALTTAALGVLYFTRSPAPPASAKLARYSIVLPGGDELSQSNMLPFALAPDGSSMVYVATRGGKTLLFLHDFATGQTIPLDGTDDARSPFFKPDGRWIGFFANRKLKKITTSGTALTDVADAPDARGGSWGTDDVIYYAPTNAGGLWKVAASSGTPTQITKTDPGASEISHRFPYALPGGKAILFMVWTGPGSDEHRIDYLSLGDERRQVVVRNADGPIAVVGDRLIYAGRQDAVLSLPWNPDRPSIEGIAPTALPFHAALDNEGASAFAATPEGMFVYLAGSATRRQARIMWVDRSGKPEALPLLPEHDYVSAAISPDGTRAAIANRGGTEEIWIYDFRTKSFTPLVTSGGSSQAPVWTTDSKYVLYRGTRQGFRNVYRKAADTSAPEERLTTRSEVVQTPVSVSPDGKWVIVTDGGGPAGSGDTSRVLLDGDHRVEPILATPASEINGHISPDGRWLAYESNVTGRPEIWVKPYGSSSVPAQKISTDGGYSSLWSRDSRELFYGVPNGIITVAVNGDSFSTPRRLLEGRFRPPANANTNFDVAKDGRFLVVQSVEPSKPDTRIEIVLNGLTGKR